MNRRNMRSEFITEEELKGQLRQQGVSELAEVEQACLEANGELSVIKSRIQRKLRKLRKKKRRSDFQYMTAGYRRALGRWA